MKKLKFFAVMLAISLFAAMFAVSCGDAAGDVSNSGNESFKGQISEQSFTTTEEAAKAFLNDEIVGSSSKATFLSYEKTGDVSSSELGKLPLGDIKASDVKSAEAGKVTYRLETIGMKSLAAQEESEDNRTQTLYVLGVDDGFRYFVPAARTGEMITKSYYEDIWNGEHYLNATMASKIAFVIEMSEGGKQGKVDVEIGINIKICENAIWMNTTIDAEATGDGADQMEGFADSLTAMFKEQEIYVVEGEENLLGCVKTKDGWTSSPISNASKISEWYEQNNQSQPAFFDYTYFEKTDDGFALAPEKFQLFLRKYGNIFNVLDETGTQATGEATYTVKNEHLTKATVKMELSATIQTSTLSYKASALCDYSDYGKTTVTIPQDLSDFLAKK